jgi:hypothetical protein
MVVIGHLQVQAAFLTRVNGKKVKVALEQARKAQRERCIVLLSL